jgi:hypothetical protein
VVDLNGQAMLRARPSESRPPSQASGFRSYSAHTGGTHLGFADVGATLGDGVVCTLFPDRTDLDAEIARLLVALGGAEDHVDVDGCPNAYCVGDKAHVGGRRPSSRSARRPRSRSSSMCCVATGWPAAISRRWARGART